MPPYPETRRMERRRRHQPAATRSPRTLCLARHSAKARTPRRARAMKETGAEYAIKIMEKRFIMKEKKVKFVMMERKVFTQLASERIVKLFYTFHDDNYLYMVMELCRGGELLDVITKHQKEQAARGVQDARVFARAHHDFTSPKSFRLSNTSTPRASFIAISSPRTSWLSDSGHIKVTDFGTAKDESEEHRKQHVLRHGRVCVARGAARPRGVARVRPCGRWRAWCSRCWWDVRCSARRNEYLTFQQILNHPSEDFRYPDGFPDVAKDLIDRICCRSRRSDWERVRTRKATGIRALKAHPFFDGVDWDRLGSSPAPYVPQTIAASAN
ncbi:hypothetical protein PINS_up023007 [Pythium insidiosum]|nr:hypothetical protein PINS_up023007 [Pythium insidiosum]